MFFKGDQSVYSYKKDNDNVNLTFCLSNKKVISLKLTCGLKVSIHQIDK